MQMSTLIFNPIIFGSPCMSISLNEDYNNIILPWALLLSWYFAQYNIMCDKVRSPDAKKIMYTICRKTDLKPVHWV